MVRFVPATYRQVFGLTEACRDRLLVRILPRMAGLAYCQGFDVEQELVFPYYGSLLLDDENRPLWVVVYTERVLRSYGART